MEEITKYLTEHCDENENWSIVRNRGWGNDAISIGVTKWLGEYRRAQVIIDQIGNQLKLKKEVQEMEDWEEMLLDGYDKKVRKRIGYETEKQRVSSFEEAKRIIDEWIEEAEEEIQKQNFNSILVSEGLVQ